MFRKIMIAGATMLAVACMSSSVSAHAHLLSAVPAAETSVAPPSEIKLNYSEGVEAKLSQVTLATEAGAAIALDKPALDPNDHKVLIVKVPSTLKPGIYKVTWHVVSVDTHKSQGSFDFTVAP